MEKTITEILKGKVKYQVIDDFGNVLAEYHNKLAAVNNIPRLRWLGRHQKLKIVKRPLKN